MFHVLNIANPDICLKIYYNAPTGEIGNAQIRELFCNDIGRTAITRIKKKALRLMIERNVIHFDEHKVNADILYEMLGLDVEQLKRKHKEMKRLEG